MVTFRFEDFLASVDLPLLAKSLSEGWWWMESIRELRPVSLTLAGDVFLIDRSNAVFFLDTNYGVVERVASGNDAFRRRLQDQDFARAILRMDLILELRSRHITATHNECFMFAVSPALGGVVSANQVRAGNFQVPLDLLGQLARQVKGQPVGYEFRIAFPGWPGDAAAPAKGSVRLHARDRPSFVER